MLKILLKTLVLFVILNFSFLNQASALSRDLNEQDFSVVIGGHDNTAEDKTKIFREALNKLTDKLSGGLRDSVDLNGRNVDYYISNFTTQNNELLVIFDRVKVLQLFRSNKIPLYLSEIPDVMVWMSIYDEKYNVTDIMSETNTNSFTRSLLTQGSEYGLKFFMPIMDSDDADQVDAKAILDFDASKISNANARYATKYYIVGSVQGYNSDDGDLVWKLFEVGSSTPVYQSVAHGIPFDLGISVAKDVVAYFAKGNQEFVSDSDVPPVVESSNFSSEQSFSPEDNSSTDAASPQRIELFGGVVSDKVVRIVVTDVVRYQDVIYVESSLKNVAGVTGVMLVQSQADQLAYELKINSDFNAISQKIGQIQGLYIPDSNKPFNYSFDRTHKNEPIAETVAADDKGNVTDNSDNNANKLPSEVIEPTSNQASAKEQQNKSQTQDGGESGFEETEAVPILDQNDVKDTSGFKL